MSKSPTRAKTAQLQIRVSTRDKQAIASAARRAGMDMSSYVLQRVLDAPGSRCAGLMRQLEDEDKRRYALAELHDLLAELGTGEVRRAVAAAPPPTLAPEVANYVAAMVEFACGQSGIECPAWTRAILPPATPFFGSRLEGLRLHLLANSPPPFRRRNVFIDTTIGGRV